MITLPKLLTVKQEKNSKLILTFYLKPTKFYALTTLIYPQEGCLSCI